MNGDVLFVAHQGDPGNYAIEAELWRTDGTAAGTRVVQDIVPGFFGSNPGEFAPYGSGTLFSADAP